MKDEKTAGEQHLIEMRLTTLCPRCGNPLGSLDQTDTCFNCGWKDYPQWETRVLGDLI